MKKYNAPKVKESKGVQILTTIWLVPFLALIIALWLAFQYYSKIGSTIKISFKSNAGLVANQSQIKLRDVTIGLVTKISLSKDGEGVIVKARMNKEVTPYLNDQAKFWIVHADVGSHGISGLDTLVSGSYIELHGVKGEENQYQFVGLEKPFMDNDAKGKYYFLSAPNSYNITESSNVYYRMVKVGRVERVGISPDGKQINFTIFVEDSYTPFINEKSQFYSRSNFAIDFSQGKLDFSIASLSQIVHGGVSIYTPAQSINPENNSSIAETKVFPLYKSLAEMKEKHLMTSIDNKIYKFKFKESIKKLEIGSPVEFNGFQVGYVTDIESKFDENNQSVQSDVYAIIYTEAFSSIDVNQGGAKVIERLVHNGLKAKLNAALPMVGAQFIDLIFDKNETATIIQSEHYALFPTTQQKKGAGIMSEVEKLVVKLEQLPLENLLNSATKLIEENNAPIKNLLGNLDGTIKNFNKTINNLNKLTANDSLQQLPDDIDSSIQALEKTLNDIQILTEGYNADSLFSAELSATLKELSSAASSIERMSRKLEKKPNALLLGDD